jgi:transposase
MTELDRLEIIRQRLGGASLRAIARALRMNRKTVAAVIRAHERDRQAPQSALPRVRARPRKLDAYEAHITALLARYPDITAVRLVQHFGITVTYFPDHAAGRSGSAVFASLARS